MAGLRDKRAQDHHHGVGNREEMDRAGKLGRAVGQRTENNLEEGAQES